MGKSILRDLGLDVTPSDLFHVVDTTQNEMVDVVELLDALLMINHIQNPGTMATLVAARDLSDRLNDMDMRSRAISTEQAQQSGQMRSCPVAARAQGQNE